MMKTPGPDHPITIEPAASRWRVRVGGHVIADSDHALVLREADYPARIYFPREDVDMAFLRPTAKQTHCPYKGDASYFTIFLDGQFLDDVVWSYEAPYPAMEAIAGKLSFYTDRTEVYAVDDAAVDREAAKAAAEPRAVTIDQVVQHTDAGDGTSQREHWPANVETPGTTDDGGLR